MDLSDAMASAWILIDKGAAKVLIVTPTFTVLADRLIDHETLLKVIETKIQNDETD